MNNMEDVLKILEETEQKLFEQIYVPKETDSIEDQYDYAVLRLSNIEKRLKKANIDQKIELLPLLSDVFNKIDQILKGEQK